MEITLYGYVYCTTNTENGRKYIGKRRSVTTEDCYLGSGTLLRRAIKRYGAGSFTKEILAIAHSETELSALEIAYIEKTGAASGSHYYNLAAGGNGGNTLLGLSSIKREMRARAISLRLTGRTKSEETRFRLHLAKIGKPRNWRRITREQYSARRKEEVANGIHPPPPCAERGFRHTDASKRLQAERKRADHARKKAEGGAYRSTEGVASWRESVAQCWTDEKRQAHATATKARIARNGSNHTGARWFHNPDCPTERSLVKGEAPAGWAPGKGPTKIR